MLAVTFGNQSRMIFIEIGMAMEVNPTRRLAPSLRVFPYSLQQSADVRRVVGTPSFQNRFDLTRWCSALEVTQGPWLVPYLLFS